MSIGVYRVKDFRVELRSGRAERASRVVAALELCA